MMIQRYFLEYCTNRVNFRDLWGGSLILFKGNPLLQKWFGQSSQVYEREEARKSFF
jgi:hypothetical protein